MTRSFIIRPEAEEDLAEARIWYNDQRAGLGEQFLLCVEEAFQRIQRMPEGALEVLPDVRRVLVRRFPYMVVYRLTDEHISVLAVYHTRRDPRGWQMRT